MLVHCPAYYPRPSQELEFKFNSTSQYQNMKKMLTTKNATITELRTKLSQYERQWPDHLLTNIACEQLFAAKCYSVQYSILIYNYEVHLTHQSK